MEFSNDFRDLEEKLPNDKDSNHRNDCPQSHSEKDWLQTGLAD